MHEHDTTDAKCHYLVMCQNDIRSVLCSSNISCKVSYNITNKWQLPLENSFLFENFICSWTLKSFKFNESPEEVLK